MHKTCLGPRPASQRDSLFFSPTRTWQRQATLAPSREESCIDMHSCSTNWLSEMNRSRFNSSTSSWTNQRLGAGKTAKRRRERMLRRGKQAACTTPCACIKYYTTLFLVVDVIWSLAHCLDAADFLCFLCGTLRIQIKHQVVHQGRLGALDFSL